MSRPYLMRGLKRTLAIWGHSRKLAPCLLTPIAPRHSVQSLTRRHLSVSWGRDACTVKAEIWNMAARPAKLTIPTRPIGLSQPSGFHGADSRLQEESLQALEPCLSHFRLPGVH